MRHAVAAWWRDEEGMTTIEYALLLALVVVVAAAGWDDFGQTLANSADEPMAVMENASPQQ